MFCDSEEWLAHPGTVGRPIGNAIVKVLDEDGRELPPGESGEVFVRLDVFPDFTYAGDEEKRRAIERDGLVTCGDVGYVDADGFLYLNDRRSDMVISGGVNIYPAEIEACLLALEGVRDCAVFGIPDEEFGEALAAHVEVHEARVADRRGRARARARQPRLLQGAARRRVQRLAAARGLRQDLQATAARALLGRTRARDLARGAHRCGRRDRWPRLRRVALRERARALAASTSRSFGAPSSTSSSSSAADASATASTARSKAASFACEGLVKPLILRTY